MEEIDEEKLLNLSLAIGTDSGSSVERKRKRKRRDEFGSNLYSYDHEGKIFRLLQVREQMLKLDHKMSKGNYNSSANHEEDGKGLHLIHLLLITATAINDNNLELCLENLNQLFHSVSLNGDSVQRVVAYFADGLAAKILTKKSPFYEMITKKPTVEEEFVAFMDLYRVSPYYQFAHFTANQAIMEAFENNNNNNNNHRATLHVIDFDLSYGFQWPSLIQSLSEKASGGNRIISLRITGLGRSLEQLRETENRLVSFSKGFRNLAFQFHGLLRGNINHLSNIIIRRKTNETVAVNLVFHLNTLDSVSISISETLKTVRSLNPCIVVMVEREGSGATPTTTTFLSTFMESLHYFAAMFHSLDDCLPLESSERLCIEKNHLGKEIKSMLNYELKDDDDDHIEGLTSSLSSSSSSHCPKYERVLQTSWKARMESHGFERIRLSSKCMIQAKLLLKIRTHYCPLQFDGQNGGGFKVFERDDGKAISLGWQDRYLLTASAWHYGR